MCRWVAEDTAQSLNRCDANLIKSKSQSHGSVWRRRVNGKIVAKGFVCEFSRDNSGDERAFLVALGQTFVEAAEWATAELHLAPNPILSVD